MPLQKGGQKMKLIREPIVRLIAVTHFQKPEDLEEFQIWRTDTDNEPQQLIEVSGRVCYNSFSNPSGRTNEQYIENLLSQQHFSIIEHAVASFYIRGVSRALTHELVRHRHFSYSQRSTRYVDESDCGFIVPDCIAEDPEALKVFEEAVSKAQEAYRRLCEILERKFAHVEDRTLRRKMVRQAARSVLPNATETALVMTGNFRAWRHFIRMRASRHADPEIRRLAIMILRELQKVAPAVFGDFQIVPLPDGTEEAVPKYIGE
jgi:thymidylate synthase (FAD)